ncbi:MAG: tRNA dihydrouridine synthase DusB [Verrucomicrobia bacterium]|nr:tRNA dihydrouridine synthase DusB [Verrucomicrobiota bacterium]
MVWRAQRHGNKNANRPSPYSEPGTLFVGQFRAWHFVWHFVAARIVRYTWPVLKIGRLELKSILCLAPLAGYTGLPFRLTVRKLGGLGLAATELVNARSLIERQRKAFELIETRPEDQPLAVQLFGAVPEEMRDAAAWLESQGVHVIDINMGCPVPKVRRTGAGIALMATPENAVRLAEAVANAVRIPVTVKMRLGVDNTRIVAPDLAKAMEDAGVAALCVHGRTGAQGFSGAVSLEGIRSVVQAVRRIPVIGNGDVTTPEAAKLMIEKTGCAGVSIGRGAFYNPWIFAHTDHYLRTGELLPEPTFDDRVLFMTRHLDRMIEMFGETRGCMMFRKIAPLYTRQFGPATLFKQRIVHLSNRPQFDEIIEEYKRWRRAFTDDEGNLLPRYRPAPLTASFM